MKSLKGSAEERSLLQRYTSQLDHQETRLQSLEQQLKKVESDRAAAQAALDTLVTSLDVDATF